MPTSRPNPRLLLLGVALWPAALLAQTPARDPSTTLEQVLPPSVAAQVLARIADARSRNLPAAALEHRALELQAKGMDPSRIPAALEATESAMVTGKAALAAGGRAEPSDAEVEAAGTAVGKGVDGSAVSDLARSAPSGRGLAVPIAVVTALVDRGLPADDALARVLAKLQARASDAELASLPDRAADGLARKPALTGQALAATKRPDQAGPPGSTPAGTTPSGVTPPVAAPPTAVPVSGGPPASVPVNGGHGMRATTPAPTLPSHPSGRP
jgi:hypothetical protein